MGINLMELVCMIIFGGCWGALYGEGNGPIGATIIKALLIASAIAYGGIFL